MIGGEGHTVPERVGPRGADNAANLVLACLPCAQAVNPPGRRPLPKKKEKKTADAEAAVLTMRRFFWCTRKKIPDKTLFLFLPESLFVRVRRIY